MTEREFRTICARTADRKRRTTFPGTAYPGDVRGAQTATRTR